MYVCVWYKYILLFYFTVRIKGENLVGPVEKGVGILFHVIWKWKIEKNLRKWSFYFLASPRDWLKHIIRFHFTFTSSYFLGSMPWLMLLPGPNTSHDRGDSDDDDDSVDDDNDQA